MSKQENEFIKKLFTLIGSNKFTNLKDTLEKTLSETNFPNVDENETFSLITNNYLKLIKKLKIKNFTTFCFENYDDCRVVIIDGKKYDFDALFSHNDSSEAECLCEIDAFIADIDQDESAILKEIEKRMR